MSDFTSGNVKVPEGIEVYSSDGEKLGKVIQSTANTIVVEKGFLFPTDYFIPTSAIERMGDDRVVLSVTKDDALSRGWENEPVEPQNDEPSTANQAMMGTIPPAADVGVLGAAAIDVNPGYASPGKQEADPLDDPRTRPER